MATVTVDLPGISGECQIPGFENRVDAVGIADMVVRVPNYVAGSGVRSNVRHSPVIVKRMKDSASPAIARTCSSVHVMNEVKINLFRTLETGLVPYMEYLLTDAVLTHVHYSTIDHLGAAFGPHLPDNVDETQAGTGGADEMVQMVPKTRRPIPPRPAVRPVASDLAMMFGEGEVEWFHIYGSTITWTYSEYVNGSRAGDTSAGWDVVGGVSL